MKYKLSIGLFIFIGLCIFSGTGFAAAKQKPNIVLLAKQFEGYSSSIAKAAELSNIGNTHQIVNITLDNWQPLDNVDLYLVLGTEALDFIHKQNIEAPILAALITSNQWYQFADNPPPNNYSALYYDPDVLRQLALIKQLLPLAKSIGLMHSENYQVTPFKSFARQLDLQTNVSTLSQSDNFYKEYAQLSNGNDGVLLVPDRQVFNSNTITKALLTSYRHNKFVFGYSKGMVNSGAVATTFSSSEQYIRDIYETIDKLVKAPKQNSRRFCAYYSVAINNKVAKSYGLKTIPIENIMNNIDKAIASFMEKK